MKNDNISLAFVIPALNEADNIAKALLSIKSAMPHDNYELVVCDNGSTDRTREIAKQNGATVLLDKKATIARLRNLGVQTTKANILVFIDADVTLAPDWHQQLMQVMQVMQVMQDEAYLPTADHFITGSVCAVPPNPSFIEKYWFAKLNKQPENYINSGHLITSRKLFELIGGFEESLKTAEDYDFCQRAIKIGARLIPSINLTAYHQGYPKTLRAFFKREVWHGKSDVESLTALIKSKTALTAITNSLFLTTTAILLLFGLTTTAAYTAGTSAIIPTISIIKKFKSKTPTEFLAQLFLVEIYFAGRTAAIFTKMPRSARQRP